MQDVRIQYPGLIEALIQVESGGDLNAIGDKTLAHKAYGCLQIRQPYVDDVNKFYGTKFKAEDCLGNKNLSIDIFNRYMWWYGSPRLLGHTRTAEDIARMHNGGPSGWKKDATLGYWHKVEKIYDKGN